MADITEKLARLAALVEKGFMTRDEFDQQKLLLFAQVAQTAHPSTLGSYRVLDEIGSGGMGKVYRARHRTPEFAARQGGDVAIKVLHSQYAGRPDIVDRFEREAELGFKLDHPGIVKVLELLVDSGRVALVMELVEGRPLSTVIGTETGPIPWTRAKPLFAQMLEAIRYAHGHGVIHRDLKPENVMVGSSGCLKVLDFGIAKDLNTGRTQTGTGMGTIDYMAPEQYLDAKTVDARADIYALGMTLYEMMAGRLPWGPEASEFSILNAKKNGQVPLPTDFYPDIPAEVVAVVMNMLEPDPSDRYPDAAAVSLALEHASSPPSASSSKPLPTISDPVELRSSGVVDRRVSAQEETRPLPSSAAPNFLPGAKRRIHPLIKLAVAWGLVWYGASWYKEKQDREARRIEKRQRRAQESSTP